MSVQTPPRQPDDLDILASLSDEELQELLSAHQQLEERLAEQGPQNDVELHEWLKFELGIDIPKVAVCSGHDAPFTFLADLYFERIEAALGVANRGGAKTFLVAVLHWLNSRFKPGCESCTFGAIEAQSFRAYAHLRNWIYDENGDLKSTIVSSLMRDTTFRNGSKIEVLGSTPDAVNGPHPQKAHADEVELMRDDTFRESRNMTVSKKLKDGRVLIPQDILTSTRKGPSGRVQMLIDEIEEAVAHGYKPPRKLYIWCIKETSAQVKNCQIARPDLPESFKCPCRTIKRGEWENGEARTLDQICCGDFHKSRGWQPYGDIVKQFRENDRETFEAQVLCSKPEMRWHYVPNWRDERHLIRNFLPDPANGPIFMAVDWGGTNPHAVTWYQLLKHEIEVETWVQPERGHGRFKTRIKEGTLVAFDEIYIAEIGNEKLGQMVRDVEAKYRKIFGPEWRTYERYADPQGKAARMDFKAMGLATKWHTTREFDEHVKAIRAMFDDDLFRAVGENCPKFVWEIKQWRIDERTGNQLDVHNHCVTGDTLVQTRDGLRLAADLEGETVDMLTQGGEYRPAEWRSYGERDVYEIEFSDGEIIRATDGHQWVVQRDGRGRKGTGTERVTTLKLEGRRVPTQAAEWVVEDLDAYARGVQNGLIYGDGTVGGPYSWMHQYGEENCSILEQFFPGRHGVRRASPHGVKVSTKMFSPALKQLPAEDGADYVRGFLAGLIAADGAVNKQGCCFIASSKREDINKIMMLCRSVGVVVAKVEEREPGPSNYPNAKTQFRIWLTKASLDETLLLKSSHRQNGLRENRWAKPYNIEVVAVRPAGRAEVFCCEEPETNTFVLGSGKLTSNCMSNFRYAVANIKKVKRKAMRIGKPGDSLQIPRQTVRRIGGTTGGGAPVRFSGGPSEFDRWRQSLGAPISRDQDQR